MTENQKQRVERRINITPYTTTPWDPFQGWSFPTSTVWDQDFGMPIARTDRHRLMRDPWSAVGNTMPSSPSVAYVTHSPNSTPKALHLQNSGGVSQVSKANGKYQVLLDVKHFAPEEITVKTMGDVVEIKGSHDEKQDGHGVISRNFTRKYTLPKEVDPLTLTSYLSTDGFLTVEAPLHNPATEQGPKQLTVHHEGTTQ